MLLLFILLLLTDYAVKMALREYTGITRYFAFEEEDGLVFLLKSEEV